MHPRRWQGTTPDMTTLYISALDTLYQVRHALSIWAIACLVISAGNGASRCNLALSGTQCTSTLSDKRPEV